MNQYDLNAKRTVQCVFIENCKTTLSSHSRVNLHFIEYIISAPKMKVYRERIWDYDKLVSKSQEENKRGVISYR